MSGWEGQRIKTLNHVFQATQEPPLKIFNNSSTKQKQTLGIHNK